MIIVIWIINNWHNPVGFSYPIIFRLAMPPKAKVKAFVVSWLEKEIDGVRVKSWCLGDPSDPGRGKCLICPPPKDSPQGKTFSIGEGFSALRTHAKGKIHLSHYDMKQSDPNHNVQDGLKQMYIETAMKNQEDITKKQKKLEEQVLEAQIRFCYMGHSHGLSSSFFSCFADLVPQLFPDSEIARLWGTSRGKHGLRATKADYFGTEGIAPYLHNELVSLLRKNYFSLNLDESSVNSKTQLDLNVSLNSDGIPVKKHLTTISMEEGTSAAEIAGAILQYLESEEIPLKNMMIPSGDGCNTIMGEVGGVMALLRREMPWIPHFGKG